MKFKIEVKKSISLENFAIIRIAMKEGFDRSTDGTDYRELYSCLMDEVRKFEQNEQRAGWK